MQLLFADGAGIIAIRQAENRSGWENGVLAQISNCGRRHPHQMQQIVHFFSGSRGICPIRA
ncbi:hypothetical protein PsyrCH409_25895 [Pseudomonas viridiflava]|nr:hypothetical protein PsyrCH409_25895 [Pseudomonas viridiflava]